MAAISVPFGLPTQQAIAQIVGASITLANASGSNSSGAATAGSASVTNAAGYSAVSFQITGTFVATIQPQYSTNNGVDWFNATYTNVTGTTATAAFTAVTTAPQWMVNPGAITQYRLLCTAYTSGTAVCTFTNGIGGSPIGEAAGGGGTNATIVAPLGVQTGPNSVAVTVDGVNGITALAGAGATGTGSLRVTAAQDITTIAGSAPGTAGTPSANVVSVQGVSGGTALPVTPGAATTGGCTPYTNASVTAPTAIKSSAAGTLYALSVYNVNTSDVFISIWDIATAGAVVQGTTAPAFTFAVPGGADATHGGFYDMPWPAQGYLFANGIQIGVATTYNGAAAVGANTVRVQGGFK